MSDNKTQPIRLLAISHNFNLEGAAISMYELICELASQRNIVPTILSFSDGPLRERYEKQGVDVISPPFAEAWLRNEVDIYRAISALSRLIGEGEYDLVYANTLLGYPAIHAAMAADKPSVWNIRESQSEGFWRDYLGRRYQLVLDAFDKAGMVIFVAEATRRLWQTRVALKQARCIHNALNVQEFRARTANVGRAEWRRAHGVEQDSFVFMCVGTLHERKGQLDLLESIVRLDASGVNPVAVCVGDSGGDYSKRVHAFRDAVPESMQDRIIIMPKQFAIADAYAAADVFVCCSRNESYPRVILEALATGLPIISTPVFGISEQVVFGESSLGYEPGDIDALCEHMRELYIDVSYRNRMASASGARFARLQTFELMVNGYGEVFMSLIDASLE